MKIHPTKLPLFTYATLMPEKKYYEETFAKHKPNTVEDAYTFGKLYYVPYIERVEDDRKVLDITVALEPEGRQRIYGKLLTFDDSIANRALADSDDKEFNFYDQSTRDKQDRVFIRTVITCYCPTGEAVLAWAYIYVPLKDELRPKVLVNRNTRTFGARARYEPISVIEYQDLLRDTLAGEQHT